MEETFGDLSGVGAIAGDLVVSGRNEEEHDQNLALMVRRALQRNIRFKLEKSVFKADSIPFFGYLFTAEGIKPEPTKIKALRNMPEPKNQEGLATFLGMVNYLWRYIPDLTTSDRNVIFVSNVKSWCYVVCYILTSFLRHLDVYGDLYVSVKNCWRVMYMFDV